MLDFNISMKIKRNMHNARKSGHMILDAEVLEGLKDKSH
jgi:hypothetical protein